MSMAFKNMYTLNNQQFLAVHTENHFMFKSLLNIIQTYVITASNGIYEPGFSERRKNRFAFDTTVPFNQKNLTLST